jgi:hypothetical protein
MAFVYAAHSPSSSQVTNPEEFTFKAEMKRMRTGVFKLEIDLK